MINSFEKSVKGDVYQVMTSSVTVSSQEFNISGYNAVLLSSKITAAATWKIDVQGRLDTAGTTMDIYDNNDALLSTGNITANRTKLFAALPDFVTFNATLVDGTAVLTLRMQPLNI